MCIEGYYKSMSRCTQCPTIPWLVVQMVFVVCCICVVVFILIRYDKRTKVKGRTLSDIFLVPLKIVVGFYQVCNVTIILRKILEFKPAEGNLSQPRSQDLFPGLGVSQGKGPGNEVKFECLVFKMLLIRRKIT